MAGDLLATPADLASALQHDVDTASATLALEVCTAVVQAAVDGQRIVQATTTEVLYGGPEQLLRLTQKPVISVTSVTYNGTLLTQGTASGNWRLAPQGLWRNTGWTEYAYYGGWAGFSDAPIPTSVVYVAGYPTGDQRLQIGRGAVLALTRGLFENPAGATSEKIDDYAVAYTAAAAALEASPALRALLRKQYGPKARMVSVI